MSGDDRGTPRPAADGSDAPGGDVREFDRTVESTALDDGSIPTPQGATRTREPGDRIDRYIILDRLGAGGMGVVYAAYDPKLDRKVALKVLHADPDAGRREASERLVAEARALARVTHPNVVAVHDVGVAGDEVYVGMELITGPTLKRWRAERPRVWRDVLGMFLEIGEGLAAVHDAGFVHRDVKPDNVLIDGRGHARVTDFGLARPGTSAPRVLAEPERALVAESLAGPRADLTRQGVQMGTPAYMAPEQFDGGAVDAASDQFSYCVALWECLYGERPFEGDTFMSLMTAVTGGVRREPPKLPPSGLAVPRWLREVVSRGLATDPRARWPSMRALLEALRAGDPRARLRRRLAIAAGVAFLLAAGGGTVLARAATEREALARCDRAAEALAWSESDGAAIRAAFERSGAAEASTIAERVVASLDAGAARWREGRRATCVAHEVRREQPPAIAAAAVSCFDGQRDTFEALVALLREGQAAMVPRAAMAAEGLVSGDACSDPRELAKRPAPPDDPATRAEVARLEHELNATLADEQVGTFDRGLAAAEAALAAALATEHRPLLALARYRVAVFAEKLGQYERAAGLWREAFDDAVMAGLDAMASSSAAALAHTEGYQLQRYDVGLRWAEIAGIYHRRGGGGDGVIEARRLDVMAVMLEQKGDLDAAIAMHEQAIAMRRAAAGDKDHSVGYGLFNLSFALESKGRRDEAAAHRREAMEIFEAHFGPNNPTTAHTYFALASLELDLGRIAAAEALYGKVLTVWRDTLGPDHPDVGDVHAALGDVREAQERPDEAVAARREALRIHRLAYATDHPNLAQSLRRLAQSLPAAARTEARELLTEAIAVAERKPAEGAEELGRALVGLGELQLDARELGAAGASFERAIAAFATVPRPPERWLARAELGLAQTLPPSSHDRAVALAQQAQGRVSDDPSDPLLLAVQAITQSEGSGAGSDAGLGATE